MSPTPRRRVSSDGTEAWNVRFRVAGAKSRETSKTFLTYDAAARFARLLDDVGPKRALEILEARAVSDDRMPTVASWCAAHIEHLSGVQDDTRKRYEAYVRRDLGRLGHMPLDAVTHEDVSRWVNDMSKAGASGKTIANKHGFLSAALARAVRSGRITSNPAEGTRLPRTEREPMVFLTHDEYTRFLDCFTPKWQPLVTTLFTTGLRWGEATALQVGDVDLNRGTVTVERAWKRDRTLGPPKSRRSRRTVAMPPELVEVLRPLVEARRADAFVFTNANGDPVRHQTFSDNAWVPAVRLANGEPAQKAGAKRVARRRDAEGKVLKPLTKPIGKRPRVHDARHSCASWLLASGIPLNVIQQHLGHESINTTVSVYGHLMPTAQAAIRDALSGALTAAHPQIEA